MVILTDGSRVVQGSVEWSRGTRRGKRLCRGWRQAQQRKSEVLREPSRYDNLRAIKSSRDGEDGRAMKCAGLPSNRRSRPPRAALQRAARLVPGAAVGQETMRQGRERGVSGPHRSHLMPSLICKTGMGREGGTSAARVSSSPAPSQAGGRAQHGMPPSPGMPRRGTAAAAARARQRQRLLQSGGQGPAVRRRTRGSCRCRRGMSMARVRVASASAGLSPRALCLAAAGSGPPGGSGSVWFAGREVRGPGPQLVLS
jgi:hypothetical protein